MSEAEAKHGKTIDSLGGKANPVNLESVNPGTSKENLEAAMKGENHERDSMYPEFIKQATTDGAKATIKSFSYALMAEGAHARLYAGAMQNLGKGLDNGYAVCPRCGFTVGGKATVECEVCEEAAEEFLSF